MVAGYKGGDCVVYNMKSTIVFKNGVEYPLFDGVFDEGKEGFEIAHIFAIADLIEGVKLSAVAVDGSAALAEVSSDVK
jgi:hypothetical protein